MKRSKIALITTGCLAAAPIVTLVTGIISSCSKKVAPDDDGISVSTKDVEVNHNNGVGKFDVILDEQPVDNAAYVYIVTAEGPHHVELLDAEPSIYNGHPAVLYDVQNGIAHVNIGFTEFVGETTKTVVGIEVRYNNRKGEWVLKHVNGINLTVTYVHNPKEQVHIFSLNDLHGVAEGYGESLSDYPAINVKDPGVIRIMQEISPVIDSHPGSFLVTAGDNNSGDMFSTAVHGESIYTMLQSMGARYSAVGNHAFEWGITPMATYQFDNWARTPDTMGNYFLASNILNGKLDDKKEWVSTPGRDGFEQDYALWQSQRVIWADPYKVVNMNGHLVCLIGLTTKATLADGNKSVVDNLSFIDYDAAVNYTMYKIETEVPENIFDSIESFVLLTHVESAAENEDGSNPVGDAADLAANIKHDKIDAVISGHSHKLVNGTVYNSYQSKDVWVGQAETEGRKYLDLTFNFDNSKPIGQKLERVTQDVKDLGMTKFHDWQEASDNLKYIREHPATSTVQNVITEFRNQTKDVLGALDTTIAHRLDTLLYPGVEKAVGGIGHGYYINQQLSQSDVPEDGGYIFDQLGAWVGYATLCGFSSLFKDDIEASTKGLTYPAVSMINQDSMKIQYKDAGPADVKLKDMYNIQTYENTTKFGYLSVWQLANVINHSLAGGNGKFNYYKPQEDGGGNYYIPTTSPTLPPTAATSLNNLSHFIIDANSGTYVDTAEPKEFVERGGTLGFKDLTETYCLYPCGPVQMYGVRFGVEAATDVEYEESGRKWKVALVETEDEKLKEKYPKLPELYILDPKQNEKVLYDNILEPAEWKTTEKWLLDYDGMVPVITNNFLFDGANWETPLVQVYMDHNEDYDYKNYPVMNFSQITRDLLIEFCNITSSYTFDLSKDVLKELVDYPWE